MAATLWCSVRLGWWHGLWRMRPVGRVLLARCRLATYAVMLRTVWHWLIGNVFPLMVVALIVLIPLPVPTDARAYASLIWMLIFQLTFVLATNGGPPARVLMAHRLVRMVFGWKLAWRYRSRWPMEWAVPANKTRAVQAEVGTTSEATVTIRPVFDAPKLAWWPRMEWPVISWWVSPPPGRTFAQFETMLDVLASNIANVVQITIDYERSSSSIGRLSVLFDDPLAEPILPDDHLDRPDQPTAAEAHHQDVAEVIDLRPRMGEEMEY